MPSNKLVSLLSTLSPREWQRFQEFASSPYFNKRTELIPLLSYFQTQLGESDTFEIDKQAIFEVVYPERTVDHQFLAYQFNYLLALSEHFLAQEALGQDSFVLQKSKLHLLIERRLDKHFKFHYKKAQQFVSQNHERNDVFWRNQFYLAEISAQAFMNKRQRQYDQSFQQLSDSLDHYYFYEKLRYSCAMVNIEGIASSTYEIKMINAILEHLRNAPSVDFHLEIYQLIYLCLTREAIDPFFPKLKELISQHQYDLSKEEQREILLFSINICARKIRKGQNEFYKQALTFYMLGIENRALFAGKHLTHWTFNNVVKLILRLEDHDGALRFMDENAQHLASNVREDTLNYNLAELAFSKGDYDGVLQKLHHIKFTDPQYFLGSRIIYLKSFFELGAFDSMASQLASFIMFLRRNKKISSDYKKTLLNFCSLLHLILRSKPDRKPRVIAKIKETKQKIEEAWLLEVATRVLR